MGTSMESIQNAYSGFAKSNYTMLDNLSLGYGGTKVEMERLLSDATELSGVKYDINNLADVYDAIHVVQTELGITGTTALESAETFSGSFASMKSALSNFLGNLALGEDVTPSLNALAETTSTFLFNNFIPMVGNILSALPTAIVTVIKTVIPEAEGVLNSLGESVNWVKDNMEVLIPILGGVAAAIAAQAVVNTVQKGYAAFKLATEGTTIAQAALNLVMNANPFGFAAIAIGALVAAGIALYKNWDIVSAKAIELKNNIAEAWNNLRTKTVEAWNNIKTDITETIAGLAKDAIDWGKNMVTGLWNGITDRAEWLRNKISEFASSIGDTIKDFFGIHSPSTLMAEYGQYIDEGLANGIENNADKPLSTMSAIVDGISGYVQDGIDWIDGLAARIANFDKATSSGGGSGGSNERYNSISDKTYKNNKDAIDRIGRDMGVDTGVATDMFRKMKGYAIGTPFVTEDQVALIHKGEAIIPAKYNPYNQDSSEFLRQGDTTINVYNPQPSPAALARQIKKAQQELALGF